MVKALFDTNILIDYLRGLPQAQAEFARFPDAAISIVTWMEVMVGAPPDTEAVTGAYLDQFVVVPLDRDIARRAVAIRRDRRGVKLPDAIVRAAADSTDRLLVTRDERAFDAADPAVRVPYRL